MASWNAKEVTLTGDVIALSRDRPAALASRATRA
jgi:hypothetical protein